MTNEEILLALFMLIVPIASVSWLIQGMNNIHNKSLRKRALREGLPADAYAQYEDHFNLFSRQF